MEWCSTRPRLSRKRPTGRPAVLDRGSSRGNFLSLRRRRGTSMSEKLIVPPKYGVASVATTRRFFMRGAGATAGLAVAGSSLPIFNIAQAQQAGLTYGLFGEPAGLNEFLYTEIHGGVVTT